MDTCFLSFLFVNSIWHPLEKKIFPPPQIS